mmetsp:Transcript_34003/g.87338  ORF Transcript_34003/g.87338 Transcript_34003/m.87338 type:complete len:127 (-) Transcript_34003:458-838(-)
MAGDVNLFLNDLDESDLPVQQRTTAELDIMIAEEKYRRQGLASSACKAMMGYGIRKLGLKRFRVKIGYANSASQSLFTRLGFKEVSRSEAFKEITFELGEGDEVYNECKHADLTLSSYHSSGGEAA